MPDSKSITTTSTDNDSIVKKAAAETSSNPSAAVTSPSSDKAKPSSWRDKLHFGSSKPVEPGKEAWRDASLSEDKRWKEWQKAKDKEQKEGGATGVFTQPYKAKGKGKWGYWLDALW